MVTLVAQVLGGTGLEDLVYGILRDPSTGGQIVPAGARLSITQGDNVFLSDEIAIVDGATGVIYYQFTNPDIQLLKATVPNFNLKATWLIDTVHERIQYFHIVPVRLLTNVTDDLLIREFGPLSENRRTHTGIVTDDGDESTLIDTKRNEPANHFRGGEVLFSRGDNAGERRTIEYSDPDDRQIVVREPFTYSIDKGDQYTIIEAFNPSIESGFQRVLADLINHIGLDNLGQLEDGGDITFSHLYASLVHACAQRVVTKGDTFDLARERFESKYLEYITQTRIKLVNDADGLIPLVFWGR